MKGISELKVKLFADGADFQSICRLAQNPLIQGFTTNPSLMRKAGVSDYQTFARNILEHIPDKPISFEVLSDDFAEMYTQARIIASWGENIYVKIPVTNSRGQSSFHLIERLARDGIKQNITAIMTPLQVEEVSVALAEGPSSYVSVFAGRIADTGRDPLPLLQEVMQLLQPYPHLELIWASPRELLNIFQAEQVGCHIITATMDILKKLPLIGKDLEEYSLETVQMFCEDAKLVEFRCEEEVV